MTAKDKEQFERIKAGLRCSDEEAMEVLEYDKRINRGERCEYDLDPTAEKLAKKFANCTDRKQKAPTIYKHDKRKTYKGNATKAQMIADLVEFLTEKVENVEVLNAERLISFTIDDKKYEIMLTAKRK